MKIKIKADRWNHLKPVSGMTLDVETDYLFGDQFNTAPVPGISDSGFRVMIEDVEAVIDDIRPSKMRCNWCGKCSDVSDTCANCGKGEYLERFRGRVFPVPGMAKPDRHETRELPGSRGRNRGGIHVLGGGMGNAGDSYDDYSHIFSVVYGPRRRDGDWTGYRSTGSFFADPNIPQSLKRSAKKIMDDWARELGY